MRTRIFILSTILLFALTTSCRTTSNFSTKVSLGMTKEELIKKCGKPYKQTAKYDLAKRTKEVLFYKEKVWLDNGWGGDYTIINHIFVFRNGKLIAIEQGEEELFTSEGDRYYIR